MTTNNANILDETAAAIRADMERMQAARDQAYQRSRELISICARAIRAIHREEWETAELLLAEARTSRDELIAGVEDDPNLYFAGYTQDAVKEYVEAHLVYAYIRDETLPTPEQLGAEGNTWLNGLAEAATELRRRILDISRKGHNEEIERLLDIMDHIYSTLVTFDFPDQVTGGLRRRTDTLRAVLERTQGDMATAYRSSQLEQALETLDSRIQTLIDAGLLDVDSPNQEKNRD